MEKTYEYLRTETLPVVIEPEGPSDDVHQRIGKAFKELGIVGIDVLTPVVKKLGEPGSPLLNIGQYGPDTKVEAGIRDEVLHLRAIHSWWFDARTGEFLDFKGGL